MIKTRYKEIAQCLVDILADYNIIHCPIVSRSDKVVQGLVDFNKRTIYLNPEQSPIEMKKTILHEMCHLYAEKYSFSQSEKSMAQLEAILYDSLYTKVKPKKDVKTDE